MSIMTSESSPTVYIETYGCQMNVSDSELMLGKLADARLSRRSSGPDGADVILVNTCAIRDHAEQRVIGRLGELKRHMKPTPCSASPAAWRSGSVRSCSIARSTSTLVIGPDGYRALPALIESARRGERVATASTSISRSTTRISRRAGSTA